MRDWPQESELPGAVGPGWLPLLDRLWADLRALDPTIRLRQVKEKMGGLRVYVVCSPGVEPAETRRLIDATCKEAKQTCELCAGPGVVTRFGGLWKCVCVEHSELTAGELLVALQVGEWKSPEMSTLR